MRMNWMVTVDSVNGEKLCLYMSEVKGTTVSIEELRNRREGKGRL